MVCLYSTIKMMHGPVNLRIPRVRFFGENNSLRPLKPLRKPNFAPYTFCLHNRGIMVRFPARITDFPFFEERDRLWNPHSRLQWVPQRGVAVHVTTELHSPCALSRHAHRQLCPLPKTFPRVFVLGARQILFVSDKYCAIGNRQ